MNKEAIVLALTREMGCNQRVAEVAIDSVIRIISNELASGRKVQLAGFGTFEVKDRAPRTGRNPKANIPVHIPARKVPYFTPGKTLKAYVEESHKQYKI